MNKIHIYKSIKQLQNLPLEKESTFVIIDNNLKHLHSIFKGFKTFCFEFSESKKAFSTVGEIAGQLMEAGADRNCFIIGIGGGITTDITGFTASIYKRGVKFGFVPTTLLSQVDASIGGKNGVNLNSYKNILGVINQPQWIAICPELLQTLPEEEFKAGIAEVLKTFILFDKDYYTKAVEYFSKVAQKYAAQEGKEYGTIAVEEDIDTLTDIIEKCAQYKCGVVRRDEFEKGERRLLNLGHTFAHAIEKLKGDSGIMHGHAVSIGMVIAAKIGDYLKDGESGTQQSSFTQMLIDDLRKVGLPALLEECPITKELKISQLADAVSKDKKVQGKNIHFIVPNGIEDVKDITIELDKIKQIANDLR